GVNAVPGTCLDRERQASAAKPRRRVQPERTAAPRAHSSSLKLRIQPFGSNSQFVQDAGSRPCSNGIMPTPFGPQLIGETEKTLGALLRRFLEGTGLSEPQWVTLRLADRLDGTVDANGLARAAADRAHFSNAGELVSELTRRGLLDNGRLTSAA